MMASSRAPVLVLLAVLAGCGGHATKDPGPPTGTPTASTPAPDTTGPSATDPSATSSATSPAVGLPTGFPVQSAVPLVAGVVTAKSGGAGPAGKNGWLLELSASGTQQQCFEKAASALVAAGFMKQGELTAGDTRQAQFTSAHYAVIISARADGTDQCQLGYEVGEVGN